MPILVAEALAQQPGGSSGADSPAAPQDIQIEIIDPPAPQTPRAPRAADAPPKPVDQKPLELVEFRELALGEAMRSFSEQTGLNIVPSADAAKKTVSLYLRDVPAMAALDALCKAYDLWYRQDDKTGIIRIYTTEEYQRDLSTFREEQTEVFTLLYPNPVDVATAIRDIYGDRVVLSLGVEVFHEEYEDLQQRFDRFDLIDERAQGLGLFGGGLGGAVGGWGGFGGAGFLGSSRSGFGRSSTRSRSFGATRLRRQDLLGDTRARRAEARDQTRTIPIREQFENLTPEQIQALEAAYADQLAEEDRARLEELLRRRQATIYVTVMRRHNQVIVRTSDEHTMDEIRQLVRRLDVPTTLVLLEVKILAVELGDDFHSVFDYQFSDGSTTAGGFTSGNILPPASDNPARIQAPRTRRDSSLGPETASAWGNVASSNDLIFQFVNDNFRFRMQLLESKNRVTVLASPLLLTANNEVSRLFVGEEVPLNRSFTGPAPIVNSGLINTQYVAGSTGIEFRPVGTTLLITPNINADRTVTLRILQELSEINENGATVLVPTDTGFVEQAIDTVQSRTVSGTVVAQDGLTVAIGGLIREGVRDNRAEVPIVGKLPVVGFFFRRQATARTREELVILIRPYVFNTPTESAAMSEELVREISMHPNAYDGSNTLGTHAPWEVLRPDPPMNPCQNTFRFHSVQPKRF